MDRPRSQRSPPRRLSGDPTPEQRVARILRVDHAGESETKRICRSQLAVLSETSARPVIREMAEGEERHLASFDKVLAGREVRPTALLPLWHVAGYALDAATALLGREGVMACTVAVEELIDGHYTRKEQALGETESNLRERIRAFRTDELKHRDTARSKGANTAPRWSICRHTRTTWTRSSSCSPDSRRCCARPPPAPSTLSGPSSARCSKASSPMSAPSTSAKLAIAQPERNLP